MRTPLAALALALAAAVPAHADMPPTDCYAFVVLAGPDAPGSCGTYGVSSVPAGNDHRVVNVYVQTGQVSATIWCGGDSVNGPAESTVVVTAPWSGSTTLYRTGLCVLTLTPTTAGTTAFATNTSGRTVQ